MEKVDLRLFSLWSCRRAICPFSSWRMVSKPDVSRASRQTLKAPDIFSINAISDRTLVGGIGRPDLSVGGVGGTADVFHDTADRIGHAVDDNGFADNLGSTVKLLGDTLTNNGLWIAELKSASEKGLPSRKERMRISSRNRDRYSRSYKS